MSTAGKEKSGVDNHTDEKKKDAAGWSREKNGVDNHKDEKKKARPGGRKRKERCG